MGTINYGTSEYITIGYLDYSQQDFDEEYTENDYYFQEEDDLFIVQEVLKKYSFCCFHVVIKDGYYDGFYIDIENNYGSYFDDYHQKQEALREATRLKKFLLEALEYSCCVVYPGWCTAYLKHNDSVKKINEAIKYVKEEIKETPTYGRPWKEAIN